jgi:hypothetical protein
MIIVTCRENVSLKCWSYDVIFKDHKWLMTVLSDIFLCVMVLGRVTLRFKNVQCGLDYSVCELSLHDRELLTIKDEGRK